MNMKRRQRMKRYAVTIIYLLSLLLPVQLHSSSLLATEGRLSEQKPPLPVFNNIEGLSTSVTELKDSRFLIPQIKSSSRMGMLVWNKLSGICVNGNDHLRYVNISTQFEKKAKPLGLFTVTEPYRLEAIKETELDSNALFALNGESLLLQCWRGGKKQPAHFMFGYGKLFSAVVTGQPRAPYDNIVFFQCPTPYRTEFFKTVWSMIFYRGLQNSWFTEATRFFAVNDHSHDNPYFCMENVTYDTGVGMYLGSNEPNVMLAWRAEVEKVILRELQNKSYNGLIQNLHTRGKPCEINCISRLKVSLLQRTEGSSKRRFVNLDQVIELASEYTKYLSIITVNSTTSFRDTLNVFNSFDILITPHGSHLTNGLFIASSAVSIIEVVATCFNLDLLKNLHSLVDYHISEGHQPVDASLKSDVIRCNEQKIFCSRLNCSLALKKKMVHSDLLVNLTILRRDIENSIEKLCDCTMTESDVAAVVQQI